MSYRGKVVLLGAPSVGKTSLLARYVDGNFTDDYHQTVGANFLVKEVDLKNISDNLDLNNPYLTKDIKEKGFKLYFWDLGGQEDKLFANEYYFIQALGAMVIFDILNKKSFENLEFWISKLKELSGDVPFIIVGNKVDKSNTREVSEDEGKNFAEKYGVEYIETSAKNDMNVNRAFESLAIKILEGIK
ncbi:MAG: Rab family GTPase [Promethearchaeota archaeon]